MFVKRYQKWFILGGCLFLFSLSLTLTLSLVPDWFDKITPPVFQSPVVAADLSLPAPLPVPTPVPDTKKTVGILAEIFDDRLGLQLADANTYFFQFAPDFQVLAGQPSDLTVGQKIKVVYTGDLTAADLVTQSVQILPKN